MVKQAGRSAAVSLLLALASAAAGQPRAEFIELPAGFLAEAISGDGTTVVGTDANFPFATAAFWTRARGTVRLAEGYWAFGVSRDGSVVVGGGLNGACRWVHGGPPEWLGTLPGIDPREGTAWAVSADGTVIAGTCSRFGFRWTAQEGMRALPVDGASWDTWVPQDISVDGRTIVGYAVNSPGQRTGAVQWPRTGGMRTLFGFAPSAFQEYAHAVSQDGAMTVGWGQKGGGLSPDYFAAVWPEDGGPPRDLGANDPAIHSSFGRDIDDRGDFMVATARTRERVLLGSAYTAQTGFFMLQTRLEANFGILPGQLRDWILLKVSGNSKALLFWRDQPGPDGYAVVHWPGYCVTDCELDGTLDIFDYLCFLNKWNAGDPYACDLDVTTGPGTCDVFDFAEFGALFARGLCR